MQLVSGSGQLDFRNYKSRYVIGDPASVTEDIRRLGEELRPTELLLRVQLLGRRPGICAARWSSSRGRSCRRSGRDPADRAKALATRSDPTEAGLRGRIRGAEG